MPVVGSELRRHPRRGIKSKLPGPICEQGQVKPVKVHGIDVSALGLGAAIDGYFPPGTRFVLYVGEWQLTLEIAWCHSHAFKESYRRCGFRSLANDVNLVEIFSRSGSCI